MWGGGVKVLLDEGVELVGHGVVGAFPKVREREAGLAFQADEALAKAKGAAAHDAVARHCEIEQCRAGIAEGQMGENRVHNRFFRFAQNDKRSGRAMEGAARDDGGSPG